MYIYIYIYIYNYRLSIDRWIDRYSRGSPWRRGQPDVSHRARLTTLKKSIPISEDRFYSYTTTQRGWCIEAICFNSSTIAVSEMASRRWWCIESLFKPSLSPSLCLCLCLGLAHSHLETSESLKSQNHCACRPRDAFPQTDAGEYGPFFKNQHS